MLGYLFFKQKNLTKYVVFNSDKLNSNTMIEYMEEMDKLGMIIMEMLAHGLGLADDFFSKNFEEKEATIFRISRYPPCPLPEKIVGIGIHSDSQTLTILYQDKVGGIQVLKDDKQWIGVRLLPNSFVINIADTLEVILSSLSQRIKRRNHNYYYYMINCNFLNVCLE